MTGGSIGGTETLVLRDREGRYYAIPRAVVEAHRVPAERTAALEELLAADRAAELDEDVLGPAGTGFAERESEITFRGWHLWDPPGGSVGSA